MGLIKVLDQWMPSRHNLVPPGRGLRAVTRDSPRAPPRPMLGELHRAGIGSRNTAVTGERLMIVSFSSDGKTVFEGEVDVAPPIRVPVVFRMKGLGAAPPKRSETLKL